MREILFKAKRLDNGEWVEGYYVERDNKSWVYPAARKWNIQKSCDQKEEL